MTPIKDNWHHTAQSVTRLQTAGQEAPSTDSGHSKIGQKMEDWMPLEICALDIDTADRI